MSKRQSLELNDLWSLYPEYKESPEDARDDGGPRWKFPKKKSLLLNEDTVEFIKAACTALACAGLCAFKDRNETIKTALRSLLRDFLGPDYESKLGK